MYTPSQFRFDSDAEMIAFMKRYSFATIVSIKNDRPVATQLPFVIDDGGDPLILSAHFAAANEQARLVLSGESLIVFTQPHAYISPAHYDKFESVPTWNYLAVHAYGVATIVEAESAKIQLLEQMIRVYEPEYFNQWNALSDRYKTGMAKGIVAFEFEVTELQGQKKLSQNKTDAERARIIESLQRNDDTGARDLAGFMKGS